MAWYLFALLATLFWAIVNIIDKYIVSEKIKDPLKISAIVGFFYLLIGSLILIYKPVLFSTTDMIIGILSGIIYAVGSILYFFALKFGEVSRVIPLFYLSPIFVIILAAITIGESLSMLKYLGVVLIVLGAILVSIKRWTAPKFDIATSFILISSFSFALVTIIQKYLTYSYDFLPIFAYSSIGMFFVSLFIFSIQYKEFGIFKNKIKSSLSFLFLSVSLNVIGVLLIILALSIEAASLVSSLTSFKPFFVFLIAIILTRFFPNVVKEKIDKRTIGKKLFAIILVILGTILIT